MVVVGVIWVRIGVIAEKVEARHDVSRQIGMARLDPIIDDGSPNARTAVRLTAVPRFVGVHVRVRECRCLSRIPQVPLTGKRSVVWNHRLLDLLRHVRFGPDDLRALAQRITNFKWIKVLRLSEPAHIDILVRI